MLTAFAATLATFLALDALWLKFVIRPVFEADVPNLLAQSPKLGVAAVFYVGYCVGIVWFAVRPAIEGGLGAAALNGALLGLVAYGCYEFTNWATLEGWTPRMVAMDVAWGTALTAVSAVAGAWAAS
jgi:uncharacterized membrane protein